MRTLILAIVVAMTATSAMAATVEPSAVTGDNSALTIKAKAVCDGPYTLTADAMSACTTGVFPAILKDGTRFRNVGVGAEFNTLIRQLPTATVAR